MKWELKNLVILKLELTPLTGTGQFVYIFTEFEVDEGTALSVFFTVKQRKKLPTSNDCCEHAQKYPVNG